ncbi:MAG: acetate/propionate family kinase [Candidatus Obscuribacterales bacterium]|nr:acetate/propionate family kinase [Candidatus Obscuribacterales bacterium]
MKILVLNAGSSSLKCSLFEVSKNNLEHLNQPLWQAQIDTSDSSGSELAALLHSLWQGSEPILNGPEEIQIIGHRIVHGGTKYNSSTRITKNVIADLEQLIELAPAHEPAGIAGIQICQNIFKNVPQIAVFDTAFHSSMDETATVYPGPYKWYESLGIRRYGFHGISHQYCAGRAAAILKRKLKSLRLIICHLGNGASLCAVKDGKSIMNTMGYTPLEGLMMGTRSGSIDPGIILHFLKNKVYSAAEITDILNNNSGLKGVSGITADMRQIENLALHGNARAKLAFDMYVDRLTANIASLLPKLGGLDALVFTGGIGQNSGMLRAAACKHLAYMGIAIDSTMNDSCKQDADISDAKTTPKTLIVYTREDIAIAKECFALWQTNAS